VSNAAVLNDNSLNLVRCSAELFSCVTRHLLLGGGRVKFPDSGIYLKCAHCATLPHTSTETLGRVFLGLGKGAMYSVIEVQVRPCGLKQTLCWSPGQLPDFDQQGSSVTSGLPFCWEHRQKQPSWRPADGTSNRNSSKCHSCGLVL
jgi:hypothetical protein